jgi:hypothetical protein
VWKTAKSAAIHPFFWRFPSRKRENATELPARPQREFPKP